MVATCPDRAGNGLRKNRWITVTDRFKQDIAELRNPAFEKLRWDKIPDVELKGFEEPMTLWRVGSPAAPLEAEKGARGWLAWFKRHPIISLFGVAVVVAVLIAIFLTHVTVIVIVGPASEKIYVDGRLAARDAQGMVKVKPGVRSFEARLEGYRTNTTNVTIAPASPMTVNLGTLEPLPAVVTVNVTPANANILVDGQPAKLIAEGKVEVLPGRTTFEARLNGYESSRLLTTNVVRGSPLTVDLGTLIPLPVAAVTIMVVPAAAEIYVDGLLEARSAQGTVQVKTGARTFAARLEGYSTNITNVTVAPARPTTVNLGTLEPLPVAVTVTVVPAAAEIYADGLLTTRSAQGTVQVKPGARTFAARLEGYSTKATNVPIAPARPTTVNLGTLEPLPVVVAVNVTPATANILVDGQPAQRIAKGKVEVLPGHRTFEARLNGYESSRPLATNVAPEGR